MQDEEDGCGRYKRWCFTLNNYSDDELVLWRDQERLKQRFRYVLWGRESGDGGTPHLQGYVECHEQLRRTCILKGSPYNRCSWRKADGTAAQNKTYCSKEGGEFFELGKPAGNGGVQGRDAERERWQRALDCAKAGDYDSIDADIRIRYCTQLERIRQSHLWSISRGIAPDLQLRKWQIDLIDIIEGVPDPRVIHFAVDEAGCAGKSTFARYLRFKYGDDILVLSPGKGVDLAYLIRPARVFLMDCPRASTAYLPWAFLEELKDGYIVSTKYECVIKEMPIPHLIIFMNSHPDLNVLSLDRYNIIKVG